MFKHKSLLLFLIIHFKGNVEIETYWLKGKRDKDGNAQAACPQFETQTISKAISKATISGPETTGDEEGLVTHQLRHARVVCVNAAIIIIIIIISKYLSLLALRFSLWWQARTRMTSSLFALIALRWRFQAILWRSPWRNAKRRRCLFIRWDVPSGLVMITPTPTNSFITISFLSFFRLLLLFSCLLTVSL